MKRRAVTVQLLALSSKPLAFSYDVCDVIKFLAREKLPKAFGKGHLKFPELRANS